jgi:hypothetical protein
MFTSCGQLLLGKWLSVSGREKPAGKREGSLRKVSPRLMTLALLSDGGQVE